MVHSIQNTQNMENTFISIIVPVYNDPEGIKTTVRSLLKQDYPKQLYEIIIADNNSDDETPVEVENFARSHPGRVRLLYEKNARGPAAARNRGIENARGSIICFMDSDMWADKDFLLKIDENFKNNDADYLGYKIKLVAPEFNIISEFHVLTGFPMENIMKNFHYAVTAALTVRKEIFDRVGMFDERFSLSSCEDLEFGNRAYKAGCRFKYSADIEVYHPSYAGIRELFRKHFKYGRGHFQLFLYYPDRYGRFKIKNLLPPHPFKIKQKYPEWCAAAKHKKLIFYLLLCFQWYAAILGYFYERMETRL